MSAGWLMGAIALAGTLLLLTNRTIPAMFLLLVFGAVAGAIQEPDALRSLAATSAEFRAPSFALGQLSWPDLMVGAVFLALPQPPLTLGNAVIAIREENNRLFPDRPASEKRLAISTGVMNVAGAAVGGVPMCHGAGGMAGHVAFGARTGGALVILGITLLLLALFFSGSVVALFDLFPPAILGVILFITGGQLALGSCDFSKDKAERFATLVTAGFAIWNVGIAFIAGFLLCLAARRGLLRL